jgi:hypothetical protein
MNLKDGTINILRQDLSLEDQAAALANRWNDCKEDTLHLSGSVYRLLTTS